MSSQRLYGGDTVVKHVVSFYLKRKAMGRTPSELRGLCRVSTDAFEEQVRVVTPPSSEVCAGYDALWSVGYAGRNPSELRGLCR